jgi:hypothetical protein
MEFLFTFLVAIISFILLFIKKIYQAILWFYTDFLSFFILTLKNIFNLYFFEFYFVMKSIKKFFYYVFFNPIYASELYKYAPRHQVTPYQLYVEYYGKFFMMPVYYLIGFFIVILCIIKFLKYEKIWLMITYYNLNNNLEYNYYKNFFLYYIYLYIYIYLLKFLNNISFVNKYYFFILKKIILKIGKLIKYLKFIRRKRIILFKKKEKEAIKKKEELDRYTPIWRQKMKERNEKILREIELYNEELEQTDAYKRYRAEQNKKLEERLKKEEEKEKLYYERRKDNWWAQRFVFLQFPHEREYFANLKKERENLKKKKKEEK